MTLPRERFNSVKNAREFLRSLLDPKQTPCVPKAIRQEAYWALRHFPGEYDMAIAKADCPEIWGKPEKVDKKNKL